MGSSVLRKVFTLLVTLLDNHVKDVIPVSKEKLVGVSVVSVVLIFT